MAQAGYTPIQLYRSSTPTNTPTSGNLSDGELAINTADGKLFYKDSSNVVQVIGWKTVPTSAGGTGLTSPGANGNVLTSNGTIWTSAALPAGGLTYVVKTANYTTQDKEGVLADTTGGAFTVTLPATPATGAQVVVADAGGVWGTNNLTVGRNGSTIGGLAENLVCDINGASVQLVYDGTTWEVYAQIGGNGGTAPTLAGNNAFTGANTFYNATGQTFGTATATNDGILLAGRAGGSASYRVTLTPATLASNTTLTLPNVTDTVATIGTAQTFTAAQTFRAANSVRAEAASTQDAVVIAGRAGGTGSFAVTLTPAALSASRTLTLPEPGENVTLGYLNIPQNSQSAAYTLVLTDAGKHILHPSADTTARTFTIPANSSVAFPVGTAVTFINQNGAGTVTISINTDTMRLAGAGTTGSRTLAANGVATAIKITSTEWIISGTGLT